MHKVRGGACATNSLCSLFRLTGQILYFSFPSREHRRSVVRPSVADIARIRLAWPAADARFGGMEGILDRGPFFDIEGPGPLQSICTDRTSELYIMEVIPVPNIETTEVNRSQLRQNQREILAKAAGNHVVLVKGHSEADTKYIIDKQQLEKLLKSLDSIRETLEILRDQELVQRLLQTAETLEDTVRRGRLYSFDEAFE